MSPIVDFPTEPFLTAKDVAALFDVSLATVYDWTYKDQIPYFTLGCSKRFLKSELIQWLNESRRVPK